MNIIIKIHKILFSILIYKIIIYTFEFYIWNNNMTWYIIMILSSFHMRYEYIIWKLNLVKYNYWIIHYLFIIYYSLFNHYSLIIIQSQSIWLYKYIKDIFLFYYFLLSMIISYLFKYWEYNEFYWDIYIYNK